MVNDFRQTVDLKERVAKNKATKRTARINRVFNDGETDARLKKIDKPVIKNVNESFTRRLVFLIAAIVLIFLAYFLFFNNEKKVVNNWYSVKLVNNDIFYGKISDTKADPIVISDVYYNYDQLNKEKAGSDSANLRLVKRGKETHGPEGTMSIVRVQVLYMELLKDDSRVLEAILSYEKD